MSELYCISPPSGRDVDVQRRSVNTTLAIRDSNPLLLLNGGSFCPTDDEITASTTIQFLCDVSVVGAGKPTLLSQFPKEDEEACSFVLQWRTPVSIFALYSH